MVRHTHTDPYLHPHPHPHPQPLVLSLSKDARQRQPGPHHPAPGTKVARVLRQAQDERMWGDLWLRMRVRVCRAPLAPR